MPRTDTASRVVAALPEKVYAALVDPEALTTWLPPDGMRGRFERFDPRPGGTYRLVLTYDDASTSPGKATADSDIVDARFVDLVPGDRVVQAEEGTRVEFIATNVPDGISAEAHAAGLDSSLENLAGYLER